MQYFIDYWDDVVRKWINGTIEQQQQLFLNENFLNLNPDHMPEPYWGNPTDCSLVIANYNPGGGVNRNIHTYKDCVNLKNCFISEVNKNGYFSVVKDFPIIAPFYGKNKQQCWWWDYKGSEWWLERMDWLQSILSEEKKKYLRQKPPFAIEYCGWHSKNWPGGACTKLYKQTRLPNTIDNYFFNALVDAVLISDAKLGICIGRQFYDLFKMKNYNSSQNLSNNKSKYNMYKFIINGAEIIVIWGSGWQRFPNINPQRIP